MTDLERDTAGCDLAPSAATSSSLTRRDALRALMAAAGTALFASPVSAFAAQASKETTEALSAAQAEYKEAQAKMEQLSAEFTQLSKEQDETIGRAEDTQDEIDATQAKIDEKQAELEQKQSDVSIRVSSTYKGGERTALSMLLTSGSWQEFLSNVFYLNKVNESEQQAIKDVRDIQAELKEQKATLEKQKAELDALREEQAAQLKQMSAKKDEVQDLLDGLSADVKELMAKRDAELAAAAEQERKIREAAKNNASSGGSGSGSGGSSSGSGGSGQSKPTGNLQQAVVNAAHSVPSPGAGLCAWWVADVFIAAGLGNVPGNACDMYSAYCTSSRRENLKVGMIIAVSSHPHTSAGAIYGHVGIYVGDNTVMDNIGYIRSCSLDYWCDFYGASVTPRWGWAKGISLA